MTSPPPSETGPSAEGTRQAGALLSKLSVLLRKYRDNEATDLIASTLREAKRSAHLEDARAGCEFCASDVYSPPVKREGQWAHHGKITRDIRPCERPEVWDALSLLGKP